MHFVDHSSTYHVYHGIAQLCHTTEAEVGQRWHRGQELHSDGGEAHPEAHEPLQRALGLQGGDDDVQDILGHLVAEGQVQV